MGSASLRDAMKKETEQQPVRYLVKNSSNKFKTMDYKHTYSDCTVHHHCTDCEHEEGDSK